MKTTTLTRRILGLCFAYWPRFATLLAIISAIAYIDAMLPSLYGKLSDDALPAAAEGDPSQMASLALTFAGWSAISSLLSIARAYVAADVGEALSSSLRSRLHAHLLAVPMGFFTHNKSGELISLFNNQLAGAQASLSTALPDIAYQLLVTGFALYRMLSLDSRLVGVAAGVIPLFLIPAGLWGARLVRLRLESLKAGADMNNTLTDSFDVDGFAALKASGNQESATTAFDKASRELARVRVTSRVQHALFYTVLTATVSVGSGLVFAACASLAFTETLTTGKILTFSGYLQKLVGPLSSLTTINIQLATASACFRKVFAYLDLKPVQDTVDNPRSFAGFSGKIQARNLCYAYPTRDAIVLEGGDSPSASQEEEDKVWALRDISFTIAPGETVALTGSNGAGKSTLAFLVARLLEPTEGELLYDDAPAYSYALAQVPSSIALLSQDVYLYNDTIAANLRVASPDASDAEVKEAIASVGLEDVVAKLPNGIQTVVGARASALSGGQRQRLALARMLLARPAVLILDEYATHLDTAGEARMGEIIQSAFADTTVIIIAHNPNTIARVDRVIHLDHGRIVSQ